MCIAAFSFNPDSKLPLTLGFNRDELYCRESKNPDYYWKEGKILAPQDKQENGSWIGINSQGVVACIINKDISVNNDSDKLKSRGQLTIDSLANKSVNEFLDFISSVDLILFRPFNLLVIDKYKGVVVSNYDNLNKPNLLISEIKAGIHLLSKTYIDDLQHPRIKENFKQSKSIDFNNHEDLILFLHSRQKDLDSSMIQYSEDWGTVSSSIIELQQDKATFKYKTDKMLEYEEYAINFEM